MKYAFMTFSTPEMTWDEVLGTAKRFGYDGVEVRIENNQKHGIELETPAAARAEARRKAEESGVAICCVATSRKYADPATAAQHVELTRQCIDLAADLGSPRVRVFGGALPKGFERADAIALVTDSLLALAPYAQERGVTLCIETHDDWCDPQHLAEVMRRVNHPAAAINWDFMHPVRRCGVSVEDSFRALQPWIRHSHIHDGLQEAKGGLQLVWIGEGIVDHRKAMELLRADSYAGYLSGEWINRDPGWEEHLPREIATLRRYERELG